MSFKDLREISTFNKKLKEYYRSLKPTKVYHEILGLSYYVWDREAIPSELFPETSATSKGKKVIWATDNNVNSIWIIEGIIKNESGIVDFIIKQEKEIKVVYDNEIIYHQSEKMK